MPTEQEIFRESIKPKSDQLNADDLLLADLKITITRVKVQPGEQGTWIYFAEGEGDRKPWKPSKGMKRVLGEVYGDDDFGRWVGHQVVLYRDPTVEWAKAEVGGIRIRAMTGIPGARVFSTTISKSVKRPLRVARLDGGPSTAKVEPTPEDIEAAAKKKAELDAWAQKWSAGVIKAIGKADDNGAVDEVMAKAKENLDRLKTSHPDHAAAIDAAITARNDANKT